MKQSIDWTEHFYYDESSPSCLRWNRDSYCGRGYGVVNALKHDAAGGVHPKGYWEVQIDGKSYRIHRVIWELKTGDQLKPTQKVDHFDGNSLDNRFNNLRLASDALNARNKKKRRGNTSGVTGVSYHLRGAWQAVWMDMDGRQRTKSFSDNKYENAFELAVAYRAKMIEELNNQGAGYTTRHGL